MSPENVTTVSLRQFKKTGRKIVCITAYDCPTAQMLNRAGADVILVGDSLGMTVLGHETTIPVTMEDMVRHTRAVVRGNAGCLVTADMPFLSCGAGDERAVLNAGRLLQEGGAHAVKIEGGEFAAPLVGKMARAAIPVMGHIGLTPQSVFQLGGYRIQGRGNAAAERLRRDARVLQDAGIFALVLECIPAELAGEISRELEIPTIGIGAGPDCDGQVLVCHDLLGISTGVNPKFVKRYAEVGEISLKAFSEFAREVRAGKFPGPEHSFK